MIGAVLRGTGRWGVAVPDLPALPAPYSPDLVVYWLAAAAAISLGCIALMLYRGAARSSTRRLNVVRLTCLGLSATVSMCGVLTAVHMGQRYASQARADHDRLVERVSARVVVDLESFYGITFSGGPEVPVRVGETRRVEVLLSDAESVVCDLAARVDGYALECGQR